MTTQRLIISRHPAAIQFIGRELHPTWHSPVLEGDKLVWRPFGLEPEDPEFGTIYDEVPVLSQATPEDVRGKIIYGNIPLSLCSLCSLVYAVEFTGTPPRGQEYTLEDMDRAGARLVSYVIIQTDQPREEFFRAVREGA